MPGAQQSTRRSPCSGRLMLPQLTNYLISVKGSTCINHVSNSSKPTWKFVKGSTSMFGMFLCSQQSIASDMAAHLGENEALQKLLLERTW